MARPKKDREISKEENSGASSSLEDAFAIFADMDKSYAAFGSEKSIIDVIDTGSPAINNAIGIGGYPRGRITHIYGPQGSGKSFLAMIGIYFAVKDDPTAIAVWFDVENSFNYDWAKKLGIWNEDPKKSKIKVIKTTKGREIFERIVGKIVKKQYGSEKVQDGILDYANQGKLNCPIIVIDSIAEIVCPREEDAPVGGLTVAALPGFLTAELKRVGFLLEQSNIALVCINQVRQTLDEGEQRRNGKYHSPGGENLAHKMSVNIFIERIFNKDTLILTDPKDTNTLIGQRVKVVIKKSRFGPAPRSCETTLLFTEGAGYDKIGIVNREMEIIDLAVDAGIIQKGGAWFVLPDGSKHQGANRVQEYMIQHPGMDEEFLKLIKESKYTGKIEKETADDDMPALFAESDNEGEEV